MLKKYFKKTLAVLLVISMIALSSISAFALDDGLDNSTITSIHNEEPVECESIESVYTEDALIESIINDSSKGVSDLEDAILMKKTHTENLTIKHEINNINSFATALKQKYPLMSNKELGKNILLALGDSEEFIATLPEEKIVEAIGYTSVVKSESFFRQTIEGEKIEISENDYLEAIATIVENEGYQESTSLSDGASFDDMSRSTPIYNDPDTKDSYIKLTSTAYKTNPSYALEGRNYFTIRGEIEWTNTPAFRATDVLAVASSGNVDQNYQSYAYAFWPVYDNPELDMEDWAYIGQNGGEGNLAYGNLLKVYNPSIYGVAADIGVAISDRTGFLRNAYLYYGISTQEDVTCQVAYAHKTLGISDPSVSIDDSGAISFSVSITTVMNEYKGNTFTLYYECYNISPVSPATNASLAYNSSPPTFYWQTNNELSGKYILEIDYLGNGTYKSYTINNSTSYILPSSEWSTIVNDSSFIAAGVKQVRWRIKINYIIYQNEPPYCTEWNVFTITGFPTTVEEVLPIIPANDRYTEKVIYLDKGGYKDIIVTFATSGNRVVQTFGTLDTVLELYSANRTLLLGQEATDDNGYANNALISYNFSSNTQYIIRVKFYSAAVSGNTKLAIVPTYPHDNYESAYGPYNTITVNWSLGNNAVALFRYQFSQSGTATLRMSSTVDTYIYIIDPTTTTVLAEFTGNNITCDNIFDDDTGGDRQALLSKSVQAGKEYLVIISFYNPSAMSGSFSITSSLSPYVEVEPLMN